MKKTIINIQFLFLAANCLIVPQLFAQAGTLDPTFGTGGLVTTDIGGEANGCFTIAIQPDGKIVAAGYAYTGVDYNTDFALVRYNNDGSIDTTFGDNGIVITDRSFEQDWAQSLGFQSDGKILLGGYFSSPESYNFALARYNIDGSLDSSFGYGGTTNIGFGASTDEGRSMVIQPDDKIIIAGFSLFDDWDFAIARFNANGILDNTFGAGGKVVTDFGGNDDWGRGVALQADGKIVVVGYSDHIDFGVYGDIAIARYNVDGSLDNSFNFGGKLVVAISPESEEARSVIIQPDGKILVDGFIDDGYDEFMLVRFNSDGTFDESFGTDGIVTTSIGTGNSPSFSIAMQDDGKIIAAGWSDTDSGSVFALVRYNIDGSIDNTFGVDGITLTDFGPGDDIGYVVALQPDGKIIAAGDYALDISSDFALARYNGDEQLFIDDPIPPKQIVSINPNPFSEYMNVLSSEDGDLSIYDLQGQEIFHELIDAGSNSTNTKYFSPGLYLLTFRHGDKTENHRIIKL